MKYSPPKSLPLYKVSSKEAKLKLAIMKNQEKLLRTINNQATGRPKIKLLTNYKAQFFSQRACPDKSKQDNHNDGRPKYLSFPDLQSTFDRNNKLPDKTMTLLKETIAQIAVSTSK